MIFIVLSSWPQAIARVLSVHLMNCRTAHKRPSTLRPSHLTWQVHERGTVYRQLSAQPPHRLQPLKKNWNHFCLDCHFVCDNVYRSLTMFSALAAVCTVDCAIEIDLITLHYIGLWVRLYRQLSSTTTIAIYYYYSARKADAPCGLRGCKNGPAPFPGRMSYKATKPGLVFIFIS